MKADVIDWDQDLPPEPEEEYQALVRSLRRKKGFGLLFVECSPAEGERVIERVKGDITNKNIEVLRLTEGVYKFYDIIENLPNRDDINILFVKGLEYSLFEYEDEKRELGWENKDIYSYSWRSVPLLLINLNQQRERFRDNFNTCFVFIMRPFAIDYLLQRAPDFFDWRSGLFKVSAETDIISGRDLEDLRSLSYQERQAELLEIKKRLEDNRQTANQKADLFYQQGLLLVSGDQYEEAIVSFDESLKVKDDSYKSWHYKGVALNNVGRYEEALASFDKALEFEKNDHQVWTKRGHALDSLESYKEALASYDEAIKLKPDFPQAWYYRGLALRSLGRFQEAIESYDKAIELKPDYYEAWGSRSFALYWSGHDAYNDKKLIYSAEKALDIFKLGNHDNWRYQGLIISLLGRHEDAITCFDKVLKLQPDDYWAWNNRGIALLALGRYEEAIASYNKALEIKSHCYIWGNRGLALLALGRYIEAIVSFYKALLAIDNLGVFLRAVKLRLFRLWMRVLWQFLLKIFGFKPRFKDRL